MNLFLSKVVSSRLGALPKLNTSHVFLTEFEIILILLEVGETRSF